jgi:hypothetical protein
VLDTVVLVTQSLGPGVDRRSAEAQDHRSPRDHLRRYIERLGETEAANGAREKSND